MIPRFTACDFNGITDAMRMAFDRDGVLVLDGLISAEQCDSLKARMGQMVDGFDPAQHKSVFSSTGRQHDQDAYFLESGHETRFFFEAEAFDQDGTLTAPKHLALNKVGHAMHDTDDTFSDFARQRAFRLIAEGLGQRAPLLLQSMYIFKQPRIGGEVVCHQDGTYLRTDPESCLGFWVAIEDATEENGCLWGIPGGHKTGGLRTAFKRAKTGVGTWHETLDDSPFEEDKKQPLVAPKGTVLVFGGLFPHLSSANRSDRSRHAYTLHTIDGQADYPDDNWLKRPAHLPFRGFDL